MTLILYVAAFAKSAVYVEKVLVAEVYAPVKTVVSIVVPSVFVTVQVRVPQVGKRLLTLIATESVQLRALAPSLTL